MAEQKDGDMTVTTSSSHVASHRARPAVLTVTLVGILAVAGCTGSSGPKASPGAAKTTSAKAGDSASGPALQQAYVSVVDKVLPSVVEIRTSKALGSGIMYDTKGDIVTNDHVVGTATSFQVLLPSHAQPVKATLVGAYPPDDLAVIKVTNPGTVQPAHFADSSKLDVGDIVLAMGNPLGLSGTVTNGIISATGRTVNEPQGGDSPGATLASAIQTSAAINPGNSGGALVDLSADVVGIPTLAAVDQQIGGGSAAPGIGFAIASNTVTTIADQIIKSGRVTNSHRGALGVKVRTVVNAQGQPAGVDIVQVNPGGPADKAGLQAGQVIVGVNGHTVATSQLLEDLLAQLQPGKTVKVKVVTSNGGSRTVSVTLGQLSTG